jgi:hypothetical protein
MDRRIGPVECRCKSASRSDPSVRPCSRTDPEFFLPPGCDNPRPRDHLVWDNGSTERRIGGYDRVSRDATCLAEEHSVAALDDTIPSNGRASLRYQTTIYHRRRRTGNGNHATSPLHPRCVTPGVNPLFCVGCGKELLHIPPFQGNNAAWRY